MKIDGRAIADTIKNELKEDISSLKERGITPKIAIITLGDESAWETYVRQKLKVAETLGIDAQLINLKEATEEDLLNIVNKIDNDPNFNGLIVQRPMPDSFSKEKVINAISSIKDIDGFRPDSTFQVPVWLAVKRLLTEVNSLDTKRTFVVIGKGETAGRPCINGLKALGINLQVIDSHTENVDEILKNGDVIISCIGKSGVVRKDNIKDGVILIGVGIHSEDGKVKGDYEESEIENVANAYTPTPGGVGPVNLAYLFSNLIEATKLQNQ